MIRLLLSGSMSGTDIMEVLEKRTQGKWRPSPGSIYPMLASLKNEGLIEVVKAEGRSSTYRLSERGHEHFREMFRHKDQVEDRTKLNRHLWLQLMEPADRVYFHVNAVTTATEFLAEDTPQLTHAQRQKLVVRIERAIQKLGQLVDDLTNGGTHND